MTEHERDVQPGLLAAGADGPYIIWHGQALVQSADDMQLVTVPLSAEPLADLRIVRTGDVPIVALLEADESRAREAGATLATDAVFIDVMTGLGRYAGPVRAALVRALAIERWSNRYRFCPACGHGLEWTNDAVAKICTNPARVHRHFPRIDPAIIVLVHHADRVLLGRAARWPAGWYSTLAGFVEPGETLEAAVRREVFEEAGIAVGAMEYFGSESWPFPRSLMLGYLAEARSSIIALNDGELEDARWFDVDSLHELQAQMKVARPFFDTIARRMIDRWLQGHALR